MPPSGLLGCSIIDIKYFATVSEQQSTYSKNFPSKHVKLSQSTVMVMPRLPDWNVNTNTNMNAGQSVTCDISKTFGMKD